MATNQQETAKKTPNRRKLTGWIVAVACAALVATAVTVLAVKMNANRVSDLGPAVEYIGQDQLRCYFWGLMCDSGAYKVYYFATNLTEEQMKEYFKGAKYVTSGAGTGSDFTYDTLTFQTPDGRYFGIDYYHNVQPSKINNGLKQTNESNGVSMSDNDYAIAKSAL